MKLEIATVAVTLAQVPVHELGWLVPVAQGSLSLAVILWFMWRDGKEREAQQKRHDANILALQEVRDALRSYMELTIIGMRAMKSIDAGYSDLMEQFAKQNKP